MLLTFDFFSGISWLNDFLWTYVLIFALLFAGLYFNFLFKGVQFTSFKEMLFVLGEGKSYQQGEKQNKHSLSSFQAFCVSTASRVGTGNLAGVATAISIGGPGAIFWMWIMALISAASSFAENILGQLYKKRTEKGGYIGGPAYYITKGLGKKWLGVIFAVSLIFCYAYGFNSVQANTIAGALESSFALDPMYVGFLIAVVTAYIIFGGDQRVAHVSSLIVPVMAGLYVLVSFYIIIINYNLLSEVMYAIFSNAFSAASIGGGLIGDQMKKAVLMGVKRGLFSNEAGMGSSPNVGASAQVSHPVKQGLIQTLGVFLDTLVICTCTAVLILLSGKHLTPDLKGIQLTQAALSVHVGEWGIYFLSFCVLLFAFSSIIGNHFYAESNVRFISENKLIIFFYRLSVVLMVFFGAIASMDLVWDLADIFMAFMALINIFAILALSKVAKYVYEDYKKQKDMGKNPVFEKKTLPKHYLEAIEEW